MRCTSCGAHIRFVETENGKKMPIDEATTTVMVHGSRGWRPISGHMSHFATCPNADKHRKPKDKQEELSL